VPFWMMHQGKSLQQENSTNTENSIALVDKLVEDYWGIMPLEEQTTEVSSELTERMVKRNGTADSSVTIPGHKADNIQDKASPDKR